MHNRHEHSYMSCINLVEKYIGKLRTIVKIKAMQITFHSKKSIQTIPPQIKKLSDFQNIIVARK